ncbi:MAG: bifunctional hydroxymethylpyrimidine kinase/phosphomethylpyrimidine kinase, partial [Promethearchaeota archaeon]
MKPSCFLIGGFDPSSGAGVSADIRTCDRLGVHPFSIITAVTYQTFKEFYGYHPLTREQLTRQLDAILKNYPVKHVKIGMIPNEECLDLIIKYIKEYNLEAILDPVTVSSAGSRLSTEHLESTIKKDLFPLVKVITPNLREALKFSDISEDLDLENLDHLEKLARDLLKTLMPPLEGRDKKQDMEKAVIIKTALKTQDTVLDICLLGRREENTIAIKFQLYEKKFIPIKGNVHGTGCVFSSAITANLASGFSLKEAIQNAELFFDEKFQHFIEDLEGGKAVDLTLPIDHIQLINQIKKIYSYISSKKSYSKL